MTAARAARRQLAALQRRLGARHSSPAADGYPPKSELGGQKYGGVNHKFHCSQVLMICQWNSSNSSIFPMPLRLLEVAMFSLAPDPNHLPPNRKGTLRPKVPHGITCGQCFAPRQMEHSLRRNKASVFWEALLKSSQKGVWCILIPGRPNVYTYIYRYMDREDPWMFLAWG